MEVLILPLFRIKFSKSAFHFSCHTLRMASRLPGVSLIGVVLENENIFLGNVIAVRVGCVVGCL